MFTLRVFTASLIFIFSVNFIFAQTVDEKAKELKEQQIALLEQIAKDAEGLRLPENRATTAAKLGAGFWKFDEKRARVYFQEAINEVITAQTQAESNKKQAAILYSLLNGISPRQEILTLIANYDAEIALEGFQKSRPSKIAQILLNPEEMKKPSSQQSVQAEIYFEQTLISRVSEQNSQRALKLMRESLAKGISYEIFGLIDKVKVKDMELATQMANELGDKLMASDFDKANQDFSLASTFVTQFGKTPESPDEKPVKVDEKRLRDLTSRLATLVLKAGDEYSYEIENLMPIVEKYSPENVAAFKQRLTKIQNTPERRENAAYEKLMASEPSPEKLLLEAEKYSEGFRSQMYYAAAEKSAQNGNINQAQKIITAKMSVEESENYLSQINHGLITKAISEGKFDQAGLLINNLPADNSRFGLLIQLATAVYQNNTKENKKQALAILEQARGSIEQPIETIDDISNLMTLATSMAEIDADSAFQVAESLTSSINEFVDASVIVSKYRNEGIIRQGELLVNDNASNLGLYNLNALLTTLKNKDFKRAMSLVNGYQKMELRLSLLLQTIEIAPEAKPEVKSMQGNSMESGG